MTETDPLKQLAQLEGYNTIRSDHVRQMQLLRYWAEELATPRHADPKRLLRYGFKTYSQSDEDGIIQEIFKRIGTGNRIFVEGWRGLWLEGSATRIEQIQKNFQAFLDERRLGVSEAFVAAENINALLEQGGVTGEIDFLSIDIDHNDYWVWKAVTVIKPRVVVIEYNAALRPPLSLVVPYDPERRWDGSNYFGASLEALVRLGPSKGFRSVGCHFAGANAFFE